MGALLPKHSKRRIYTARHRSRSSRGKHDDKPSRTHKKVPRKNQKHPRQRLLEDTRLQRVHRGGRRRLERNPRVTKTPRVDHSGTRRIQAKHTNRSRENQPTKPKRNTEKTTRKVEAKDQARATLRQHKSAPQGNTTSNQDSEFSHSMRKGTKEARAQEKTANNIRYGPTIGVKHSPDHMDHNSWEHRSHPNPSPNPAQLMVGHRPSLPPSQTNTGPLEQGPKPKVAPTRHQASRWVPPIRGAQAKAKSPSKRHPAYGFTATGSPATP